VRVFLEGTDGDSVVSKGYERFIDLANEGDWETIVEEVMALTVRYETTWGWFPNYLVYPQLVRLARSGKWGSWLQGSAAMAKDLGRSRRKMFLRYGVGAFVPSRLLESYRKRARQGELWKPLIREGFARRVRLQERERALWPSDRGAGSAREDHARVLALPRYQFALELIDGVAAAFGIEPRYPFFDRRLVEFCIAIPPEQKLAGGWTRLIQRRAMEGILPPVVQWRVHKGRLGYNFVRGMREIEAPKLGSILFQQPSMVEDFVDMDVLRAAHARFLSTESYPEANEDAMLLYKATVLARWLRDHGPSS
jgi:asparagine synthase (glutamine-hydrolysing)